MIPQRLSVTSLHCEVRDWLLTDLLIDNSGRSENRANMTTREFNDAVLYKGTNDDPARYEALAKDHKTAKVYGSEGRKSLTTGVHANMPDQQDHLVALTQHKPQTQAKYYCVNNKVNETDLGRQELKNLVAMKNVNFNLAKKETMVTESLRFWHKYSDKQTCHLTKSTEDLVTNNVVKEETVWERVTSDP
ncbi:hypothetical protein ACROYT_G014355 [Oculina patagonica]